MSAIDLYPMYYAIKLHFTAEKFRLKPGQRLWVKSAERHTPSIAIRSKLTKLYRNHSTDEMAAYFVANFVAGDKYGGIFRDSGDDIYMAWVKRTSSITKTLTADLNHLRPLFPKISDAYAGYPPALFNQYLAKKVSPELLSLLCKYGTFRDHLRGLKGDPLFGETAFVLERYDHFLPYVETKFKTLYNSVFGDK